MIEFIQHVPTAVDKEPGEHKSRSLEKLLDWLLIKGALEDPFHDLVFSYCEGNMLMISSITDDYYWPLGYVKGVDLRDYLPYYRACYLYKKGKNKVFRFKPGFGQKHIYGAEDWDEYLATAGNGSYALTCINKGGGIAWISENELVFRRYSTQVDVDRVNELKTKETKIKLEDCYFYHKYKNK